MPKSAAHPNLKVIFIVAILALGGLVYMKNYRQQTKQINEAEQGITSLYTNDLLHFALEIPNTLSVHEGPGDIRITEDKSKKEIVILTNATDFNDLDTYLKELDTKNKTNITTDERTKIGGNDSSRRIIKFNNGETQLAFNIYVNGRIYILQTNSPSLYSTLDQIAHSFRYTPN